MRRLLAIALCIAAPLTAQSVVDPGMTRAHVIARLGAPVLERAAGDDVYLFFRNGCEKRCGMSDLVVLRKDAVIDAVFRAPQRRFSGTSSSPRAIPAVEARKAKATVPASAPPGGDEAVVMKIELKSTAAPAAGKKP